MSKLLMSVIPPPQVAVPRGARWAGAAAAALLELIARPFRAGSLPLDEAAPDRGPPVEAPAAPRTAQDLRALARAVEGEQPELAHELRGIALHREAFDRNRKVPAAS